MTGPVGVGLDRGGGELPAGIDQDGSHGLGAEVEPEVDLVHELAGSNRSPVNWFTYTFQG